ncbi:uncharacterized protein PG986_010169 [Apiospora aurea]|uniref:Uncharacterized protein n=1 Tax=Apiospora aurea TaxID=335848 RepID=A0ABR1Q9V2_9PEZI
MRADAEDTPNRATGAEEVKAEWERPVMLHDNLIIHWLSHQSASSLISSQASLIGVWEHSALNRVDMAFPALVRDDAPLIRCIIGRGRRKEALRRDQPLKPADLAH